jgi:hypothetical protein
VLVFCVGGGVGGGVDGGFCWSLHFGVWE